MRRSIAVAALLGLAGSAQAAFFSFASDNNHTDWTFKGLGPGVFDADDPLDPQVLLVDDENGVLPALAFPSEFEADFNIAWVASVPLGGGNFLHTYTLDGAFAFVTPAGPLLTAVVENATLTAVGKVATWETSTATIQGSDILGFSTVNYTWFGPPLPAYGLFPQQPSVENEDFAFTLTVLNHSGAAPFAFGVALDPAHLPAEQWWSEGSYSGRSTMIPTPGAMALLALGGAVAARRRRA